MSNGHVDFSFLQSLSGGDKNVIKEVLALFELEVPKYFAELDKAYEIKDWESLANVAHKAKSSFALMGISEVVSELKNTELQARNKHSVDDFQGFRNKLELIYNNSLAEIKSYIS